MVLPYWPPLRSTAHLTSLLHLLPLAKPHLTHRRGATPSPSWECPGPACMPGMPRRCATRPLLSSWCCCAPGASSRALPMMGAADVHRALSPSPGDNRSKQERQHYSHQWFGLKGRSAGRQPRCWRLSQRSAIRQHSSAVMHVAATSQPCFRTHARGRVQLVQRTVLPLRRVSDAIPHAAAPKTS